MAGGKGGKGGFTYFKMNKGNNTYYRVIANK